MAMLVEFTVEPFHEGAPGPHVRAAFEAASVTGVEVDFGPFGTTAKGDDAVMLDVVDAVVRAAVGAGATRVTLRVERL
jgi:uncharacterized protein YqgV (UPF0045/DUF77 family)